MIEISQIINTETNLVIFKVIDSLFMLPSLLGKLTLVAYGNVNRLDLFIKSVNNISIE